VEVFVTGATGLIGRALCAALLRRGDGVVVLSRSPEAAARLVPGARVVGGDPAVAGPWQDALARADACVNLAGEPLDARWNEERKRRFRESRIAATRNVAAVLRERGPGVLVSASAVGFYGDRGDEELTEDAAPGDDFLARLCRDWEEAAAKAGPRARVALLRTGLVLARDGGALPRMAAPFRVFAGGPLGDGSAFQPWIHLADEVGLALLALDDDRAIGPINAAGPAPARNRELARAIGKALRRPALLPAPAAAIRIAVGEMADVVLASQRVLPRRALALGYRFRFPEVGPAVADLLR
jgi:uncharacterized protein (TIGR01777 family)